MGTPKDGLEKYRVSKLMDEMERDPFDVTNYKAKVKDRCFICGNICNPKKIFEYYIQHGNACHPRCYKSGIEKRREENEKLRKPLKKKI